MTLADSIKLRLQDPQKNQLNAYDFTISRVPPSMSKGKEKYFEPNVISIGPYHRGKDKYQAMEPHKWGQLQCLLARNPETNLEACVEKLRSLEMQARRCYFEPIMLSSDDFVEMLLLDGCFILEILLKNHLKDHGISPMSTNSLVINLILDDIFLLENQIPFFILQSLFNCLGLREVDVSLTTIVTNNFRSILGKGSASVNNTNFNHLLHLVHHHRYCIPPELEQADTEDSTRKHLNVILRWLNYCSTLFPFSSAGDRIEDLFTVRSAKRLQEAGITFKKKMSATVTDIHITFNKGVLEIPKIFIDSSTGRLLMNLVAFEQSNLPNDKRHLTDYMGFMNDIIDTDEDVEILEQNGIIESDLTSDSETAFFFNHIVDYAAMSYKSGYLAPVVDKVNKHMKSCWPRWRGKFIRDYIFSPWAVFSLIAALLLLSLAFIQTFCTIYPCNKK